MTPRQQRAGDVVINRCSTKDFSCWFDTARVFLRMLATCVRGVLRLRTTAASRYIALVLGVCPIVFATFVCWQGSSRPAVAKTDPPGPTVDFHVDQLEVEAKRGNDPPTKVTVSNGNERGGGLDFSAEVLNVESSPGPGGPKDPAAEADKVQQSLIFLNDPLDPVCQLDFPNEVRVCFVDIISSAR